MQRFQFALDETSFRSVYIYKGVLYIGLNFVKFIQDKMPKHKRIFLIDEKILFF